jgi:hypothetical protein
MKYFYSFYLALPLLLGACHSNETSQFSVPDISGSFNFIVANDLGRNGYYEQKPVARIMGAYAEEIDIELVAAVGDVHHFEGVESVSDPLWMTNYELIYDHPELMIDWYAVAGNHEYRGNTQAVLDYASVSRRWNAPSKYYARTFAAGDSSDCLLLFIDTTPLIDSYREDSLDYPDACKQDMGAQLQWIDSVLTYSTAKWKIVLGHHPVYAATKKSEREQMDLQDRLAPLLEGKADAYFSGHIHNFQHIRRPSSEVQYVVNSAGSLARDVEQIEGTQYCSPDPGFSICSLSDDRLVFYFINHKGKCIYQYAVSK